jgi:hypothetical protein
MSKLDQISMTYEQTEQTEIERDENRNKTDKVLGMISQFNLYRPLLGQGIPDARRMMSAFFALMIDFIIFFMVKHWH